MKKKKIITSLASVAAVAAPIVAITACTESDGNRQIQSPTGPTANLVGEVWTKCGDVNSRFQCYDNGTATLVECKNEDDVLVIPATVLYEGTTYDVTRIANLAKKDKVDGLDFSQATNLTRIDDYAFQHWSLVGSNCNWDFSNTKLEYIGYKAFDNAMAKGTTTSWRDKNLIDAIKFPNTINWIGEEAFGQDSAVDPKTDCIIFTTTNENNIKNIKFCSNWQPHKDDGCSICVPTDNLIDIYKKVENFNPNGFGMVSGTCVQCGDVYARFLCNDDNTATMIDCYNMKGNLIIPATVTYENVTYDVTRIAKLDVREKVDGLDFSQATNLTTIDGYAFARWSFDGPCCNWDFTNTKLESIGDKAFDNAMASGYGENDISKIVFPKTIRSIGWEAFGQVGSADPKTTHIEFTTTDITAITSIQFGSDWQPHKHKIDDCYVFIPTEDLISVYNSVTNFNPNNYTTKVSLK